MASEHQTAQSAPTPRSSKNGELRDHRNREKQLSKGKRTSRDDSFFLAKNSSDMKWQRAKMVIGALQVRSEPFLQPKEDMKPLYKAEGTEGEAKRKFEDALQAWVDLDLRKSFTKACADLPDSACCFGLTQNDSGSTIKEYAVLLNNGWIKFANNKLKSRGFKIDAFVWKWGVATGKTTTNHLLIRFFEISTYRFRRASHEGSLDLDDMLMQEKELEQDDSSHYSVSHDSIENNN